MERLLCRIHSMIRLLVVVLTTSLFTSSRSSRPGLQAISHRQNNHDVLKRGLQVTPSSALNTFLLCRHPFPVAWIRRRCRKPGRRSLLVGALAAFAPFAKRTRLPFSRERRTVESGTVQELRCRLQAELPKPVEIWGVRVVTRGAKMAPDEKAVLSSFLRARDWDVNDTVQMFTSSWEWRQRFGVDKLRNTKQFGSKYPDERFAGYDAHGRLLLVLRLGELSGDVFKDMDKFVRWRVHMQEALNSQLDFTHGEPSYTLVLNCEGFSKDHFSKSARRACAELSKLLQDNYPDFLHEILICNPPGIFSFAFGLLRPFLPRNVVKMVHVYQCDEESCIEERQKKSSRNTRARTALD